jgi:hypothetical protein
MVTGSANDVAVLAECAVTLPDRLILFLLDLTNELLLAPACFGEAEHLSEVLSEVFVVCFV